MVCYAYAMYAYSGEKFVVSHLLPLMRSSSSRCSALSADLLGSIVLPAAENSLSDEALLAGTEKKLLTTYYTYIKHSVVWRHDSIFLDS